MSIISIHQQELSWILSLQSKLRSSFLDLFFLGWSFVDSFAFAMILITTVWQFLDRKKGLKLFFILILSGVVNHTLKELIGLPRPCQIDPSVGLLCLHSYGFPSGAAQTAVVLWGVVCTETKRSLYRWLIAGFAALLCFSRLYLGVHYFTDVLGGILVGSILALIYAKAFPSIDKYRNKFFVLFPIALFLIGGFSALGFISITLGVELGWIATSQKREEKKLFSLRLIRSILIIVGLFALAKGSKFSTPLLMIFGFTMGVWLSYLGEWMVKNILRLKATG